MFFGANFAICMHDQQQHPADYSQSVPTLLALFDSIQYADGARVVKNKCRRLKANPVLGEIPAVLAFVPLKGHRCTYNPVHIVSCEHRCVPEGKLVICRAVYEMC